MYEIEAILITSFSAEAQLQSDLYSADANLQSELLTAEAELNVNLNVLENEVPIINQIDGGDFSDDSQFDPINGLLNGGSL